MSVLIHAHLAPFVLAGVAIAISSSTWALEPGRGGYIRTGEGVRTTDVARARVKVYVLRHEMKVVPRDRTRQAMVDEDTNKKFTLRMMCDVGAEALRASLRDAYLMNGFTEGQKIRAFTAAIARDMKEGAYVTIVYDAESKNTTITAQGCEQASATLEGVEFMHATWSLWFGKNDQPALADALMSRLR